VAVPENCKGYNGILNVLIISGWVGCYAVELLEINAISPFVPTFTEVKTEIQTQTHAF
jgi:hypothetical protein